VPLNGDPGANPTAGTINEWQNNPYAKVKLMPTAGGPPVTLSQAISAEKIFGSKMVYYDDNFMAGTSAIPINNWYWAIGIAGGTASANEGFVLSVEITMQVEFFSRKYLSS